MRTVLALATAALFILPIFGPLVTAAEMPRNGLSDDQLVREFFPADPLAYAPDPTNPIEVAAAQSQQSYTFDVPGGKVKILAIGAQREGTLYNPGLRQNSFHTLGAPEATIRNGQLSTSPGGDSVNVVALCRFYPALTPNTPSPCPPGMELAIRVGYGVFTSTAATRPSDTVLGGAPPAGQNLAPPSARWAPFEPSSQFSTWYNGGAIPPSENYAAPAPWVFTAYPGNVARWSSTQLVAVDPAAATDYTVFAATFSKPQLPRFVYDPVPLGLSVIALADVQLWMGGLGQVAAIREPLWRTATGASFDDDQVLHLCSQPFPGAPAAHAYATGIAVRSVEEYEAKFNGPIPSWMRSCIPHTGATIELKWSDIAADPEAAALLENAARRGAVEDFAGALREVLASRFALFHPDVNPNYRAPLAYTNFPPYRYHSCNPDLITKVPYRLPCMSFLPAGPTTLSVADVRVLDRDTWKLPADAASVYGGPTLVKLKLGATWTTAATVQQVDLVDNLVSILITPDPTEVTSSTVRIPEGDKAFVGGVVGAAPPDNGRHLNDETDGRNAAGVITGPVGRASTVPLVDGPATTPASPFLDAYSLNLTSTSEPLMACVRDMWAHNNRGAVPNVMNATGGPTFGLSPEVPTPPPSPEVPPTCRALLDMVNLTLPGVPIVKVLEIRKGPKLGIEIKLPTARASEILAELEATTHLPLSNPQSLLSFDPETAPWLPTSSGFEGWNLKLKPFPLRIVVVLPETWSLPVLADASMFLTYVLSPIISSSAIEIDDLPLTPTGKLFLDHLAFLEDFTEVPQLPILVPAGVLPLGAQGLHPQEKLFTITGLASHPYAITIGSGSFAGGVDPWTRLGPSPLLAPKPDFLVPGLAGYTAMSVANIVPVVEALHLTGVMGSELIRGTLAGLAVPVARTDVLHTFYMQGYGVVDPLLLVADLLPEIEVNLTGLIGTAMDALRYHGISSNSTGLFTDDNATLLPHRLVEARKGPAVYPGGNRTYVVGPSETIEWFDPEGNATAVGLDETRLPGPRAGAATATNGFTLYLFGGMNGTEASRDIFHVHADASSTRNLSTFFPNATLPWALTDAAASYHGSRVYLFGGSRSDGPTDEILVYDTTNYTTSRLSTRIPTFLTKATAVTAEDRIFLLGGHGCAGAGCNPVPLDTIFVFDPANETLTPSAARLPTGRYGMSGIYDGENVFVFGGVSATGRLSQIVRVNGSTAAVAISSATLPTARAYTGASWDGEHAYVVGGEEPTGSGGATLRDIVRFTPARTDPTWNHTVDTILSEPTIAQALSDPTKVTVPNQVFGIALPPGSLDPIDLKPLVHLHVDTPVIPLVLFTDWGVTNYNVSTPALIKVLDAEATVEAAARSLFETVEDLAEVSRPVDDLYKKLKGLVNITFAGPDHVTVETYHYYLFDLLTTDLLWGIQANLTQILAEAQEIPTSRDVVKEILDITKAILPHEYDLTHEIDTHVEAQAEFTDEWPCVFDDVLQFARDLGSWIDGTYKTLEGVSGVGAPGGAPSAGWVARRGTKGTAGAILEVACGGSDPRNLIHELEFLRREIHHLMELDNIALNATGYPQKFLANPGPLGMTEITRAAANASLGVHALGQANLALTLERVEGEIDAAISLIEALLERLAPTRNTFTAQPRLLQKTDVMATRAAPLGPYVGITAITTHDLEVINPLTGKQIVNPLTGEPILRDVTVPVPSLLWNNPSLNVRMEYRDGTPVGRGSSLILHDPVPKVFKDFRINFNVTLANITIPVIPHIDEVAPVLNDSQIEALVNKLIDELNERIGDANGVEDYTRETAERLLQDALARLTPLLGGAGALVLDTLLANLYSKPLRQGGITGIQGTVPIPELFPSAAVSKYYPYDYTSDHALVLDYPYANPGGGEDLGPLQDIDQFVHRNVRDLIVGPDGAMTPNERARWAHLPAPPPDAVLRTTGKNFRHSIYEIHEDSAGPYHQFELDLNVGLDPNPLLCALYSSHNALFETGLIAPGDCPLTLHLPNLPDSIEELIDHVCLGIDPEANVACVSALYQSLVVNQDPNKTREVCIAHLSHPVACDALLAATDTLATLLNALQGPSLGATPIVPFVKSLRRAMLDNKEMLNIDRDSLIEAAIPVNPGETLASIEAAVDQLLAGLDDLLNVSVEVVEPVREAQDHYTVAQGIKSHVGDRISGLDWTAVTIPDRFDNLSTVNLLLDHLNATIPRLTDEGMRQWAFQVEAALEDIDAPTLAASLLPPTEGELRERHIPVQFTDRGTLHDTPPPIVPYGEDWYPSGGVSDLVNYADYPEPALLHVAPEAVREALDQVGVDPGDLPSVGASLLAPPQEESVAYGEQTQAAAVLASAYAAQEDPVTVARRLVSTLSDALTYKIERNLTTIRANSTTPIPKLGMYAYTVPLAPQEHIMLRMEGEYYFENSDALLIVTPHDIVKDLLLASGEPLTTLLSTVANPTERAGQLMGAIDLLMQGLVAQEDAYLRIRHLNPLVQLEYSNAMTTGGILRYDGLLAKYGGLRVKGAEDLLEWNTYGVRENQFGFDEMHLIYVFFPLIDSTTVDNVQAWSQAVAQDPRTAPEILSDLQSKFIISDFGLMWDTYVGVSADDGVAALNFPAPFRSNIEDQKLAWAIPAGSYLEDLDLQAGGPGAHFQGTDPFDLVAPPPSSHQYTWSLDCGDTYAPGKWYAPSGGKPRGLSSGGGGRSLWSEVISCQENTISNLLPAKKPAMCLGARPHGFSHPPHQVLSAFQYDFNTPLNDWESHASLNAGILKWSELSGLYHLVPFLKLGPEGLCDQVPRIAGLIGGLAGGLTGLLLSQLPLGLPNLPQLPDLDPLGKAMAVVGRGTALADLTKGFALSVLNELVGLGIISDLGIAKSYLLRSTLATGVGLPASYFAVLDEKDLHELTNGSDARPEIWVRDVSNYDPTRSPATGPAFPPNVLPRPTLRVPTGSFPSTVEEIFDTAVIAMTRADEIASGVEGRADDDLNRIDDGLDAALRGVLPTETVHVIVTHEDVPSVEESLNLLESLLPGIGLTVTPFDLLPAYAAAIPAGVVPALAALPGVDRVYHDSLVEVHLDRARDLGGVDAARERFDVTGLGATIAILDTGIDAGHPALDDLDDNASTTDPKVKAWLDLVNGNPLPYDDHSHGTHVAGIAAGTPADAPQYSGVAPAAGLVIAKVLDRDGRGRESAIIAALDWIVNENDALSVDVVSMSLGANRASRGDAPLDLAVDRVTAAGIPVVVAAGNSGPGGQTISSPGTALTAITVGAVDDDGYVAPFSSRGPTVDGRLKPEIAAPGVGVKAPVPNGGYYSMSGTSMATPFVAGVIALMVDAANAPLSPDAALEALTETAVRGTAQPDTDTGHGIVDALSAVSRMEPRLHDLAVARLDAPRWIRPNSTVYVNVTVENRGVSFEASTNLSLWTPAGLLNATLDPLPPGESVTVTFTWTAPEAETKADLVATLGALPDGREDEVPDNNNRTREIWITRLSPSTRHQFFQLTPRFAPARIVVGLENYVTWKSDSKVQDGRGGGYDQYGIQTRAVVTDGYRGEAVGAQLAASAGTMYMSRAKHPMYGKSLDAEAHLERLTVHVALGGAPPPTLRTGERLIGLTPPGLCWALPMATAILSHGTCWEGYRFDAPNVGGKVHATTQCLEAVEPTLEALTVTAVHGAAGVYEGGLAGADNVLWPLWTGSEPSSAGVAGGLAAAGGAGAGVLIGAAASVANLALACANSVQVWPDLPFNVLGNVANVMTVLGHVPAVTDLNRTLPIPMAPLELDVEVPTPPTAPGTLAADAGPGLGEMTLRWTPPGSTGGSSLTGYRIERETATPGIYETIATVPANVQAHVDSGLSDGKTLRYRVTAVSSLGLGLASAEDTGTTYTRVVPNAVSGVTVAQGPGRSVLTVTWQTPASNAGQPPTQYEVYRRDGPTGTERLLTTVVGARTLRDAGLADGASYTYRIRAVNDVGPAPGFSTAVTQTTFTAAVPSAPTALAATSTLDGASLTWVAPAANGGLPASYYRIHRGAGSEPLVPLADVKLLGYVDKGLPPGTTWRYAVQAVSDSGLGAMTAPVTVTTLGAPVAPANVVAASGPGLQQITVRWTPPAANGGLPVETYAVYEIREGVPVLVGHATPALNSFVATGIPTGATRTYEVRAVNDLGEGTPSARVTGRAFAPPSAPVALAAVPGGKVGEIHVSWQPPVDDGGRPRTSYALQTKIDNGPWSAAETLPATATSAMKQNLQAGKVYRFKVSAVNPVGTGAAAETLDGTIPRAPLAGREGAATFLDGRVAHFLGGTGTAGTEHLLYDLDAGTLVEGPSLPEALAHAAVGHHNGKTYVLGGATCDRVDRRCATDHVWRYDPTAAPGTEWTLVGSLPTPRREMGYAQVGSMVYLFGGMGLDGNPTNPQWALLDQIVRFDMAAETLRVESARLAVPLAAPATTVHGGSILLFGGDDGTQGGTGSPQIYSWDRSAAPPVLAAVMTEPRLGSVAVSDGKYAYALGGCTVNPINGFRCGVNVVRFEPLTKAVTLMAHTVDRRGAAAVWADDYALLFGGCSSAGCHGDVTTYRVVPGPVTGLTATVSQTVRGQVDLQWSPPNANTYNEVTYRVYRQYTGETNVLLAATVTPAPGATTILHSDGGLESGRSVKYWVVAMNDGKTPGQASAQVTATTPTSYGATHTNGKPSAPAGLTVSPDVGRLILAWSKPQTFNHGSQTSATAYHVEGQNADGTWAPLASVAGNVFTWTHEGLGTSPVTKTYRVVAESNLQRGTPSWPVAKTTYSAAAPEAPTSLTASRGGSGGTLALSWGAPFTNDGRPVQLYDVYAAKEAGKEVKLATVTSPTRSYTHGGLGPNETWHYRVVARSTSGSSDGSTTASATTHALPTHPRNLVATPGPQRGQVTLRWDLPAYTDGLPVTQWVITGGLEGNENAVVFSGALPGREYRPAGLPDGAKATYRVTAKTSAGAGPRSADASAVTYLPPSAPEDVAAVAGERGGEVTLTWRLPETTHGLPITGYKLYRSPTGTVEESHYVTTIAGGAATKYVDGGLATNTRYWYRLHTVTAGGTSLGSEIPSAKTFALPGVPTNVTWSRYTESSMPVFEMYSIEVGTPDLPPFDELGLPVEPRTRKDLAPPTITPPTGLLATSSSAAQGSLVTKNKHIIEWTRPTTRGDAPVEAYYVYRRIGGDNGATQPTAWAKIGEMKAVSEMENDPSGSERYVFLTTPEFDHDTAILWDYAVSAVNVAGEGALVTATPT